MERLMSVEVLGRSLMMSNKYFSARFPLIKLVYTFADDLVEKEFTTCARSIDFAKADLYIWLRLNGDSRNVTFVRYEILEE